MGGRFVQPPNRAARNIRTDRRGQRHQVERLHQLLPGPIRGTVVHDNDLELRIADGERGLHRVNDRRGLVVGGNDHAHRFVEGGLEDTLILGHG